jgi:hypothetical protein
VLDQKKSIMATLLGLLISTGCRKPEQEGYRVTAYDGATYQWTIMRNGNFNGKYLRKRLIVLCDSYQWGQHESLSGEDACHLQVGELIVPNPIPGEGKEQEFVDVYEMPQEMLSITEGHGDDRVSQRFKILKYEVLPDGK